MLEGIHYTIIACAMTASLTAVVGIHIVFSEGDSGESASIFRDVAIALIQVTGGAVGGGAIGYAKAKKEVASQPEPYQFDNNPEDI